MFADEQKAHPDGWAFCCLMGALLLRLGWLGLQEEFEWGFVCISGGRTRPSPGRRIIWSVRGRIFCWTAGCFRGTGRTGARHQLAPGAAPEQSEQLECGGAVACAHRPLRRSAAAGEAGISRADLYDAGDDRPVRADAEGRAHIQESDAEFMNKRHGPEEAIGVPPGPAPMQPLYTQDDAAQVNQLFKPVKLHEPQLLAGSTKDAGFTMTLDERGTHAGVDQRAD